MSDTPRTDEIWGSMHGSGYQMMLLAQKLERELAALQKECGTAIRKSLNEITYREMAEVEADKWLRFCTEWSETNVKLILRAEQAEKELAEAKKKYLQVCAQHGRLVDQVYEEDGETLKHIAAEEELAACKADAARYRWMKQEVKRIPPNWAEFGWDTCIDIAIKGSAT